MQKVSICDRGYKLEETHNFSVTKSIKSVGWQEVDDNAECEPNVGQSEPREDEAKNIVLQTSSYLTRIAKIISDHIPEPAHARKTYG